MFIVTNTLIIEKKYAQHVIQRFLSTHTTEQMKNVPGFLGIELLQKQSPQADTEEVVVLSRWETQELQQKWQKSAGFQALHKKDQSVEKKSGAPSAIHSSKIDTYKVISPQQQVSQ